VVIALAWLAVTSARRDGRFADTARDRRQHLGAIQRDGCGVAIGFRRFEVGLALLEGGHGAVDVLLARRIGLEQLRLALCDQPHQREIGLRLQNRCLSAFQRRLVLHGIDLIQ
jgi:hypothetical protein